MKIPAYDTADTVTDDIYGLMAVCDVIAPLAAPLSRDKQLLAIFQKAALPTGKTFEGYNCGGGGWIRGPNAYFRKMAWQARDYGMTGMGIWCYMNSNTIHNAFDDFTAFGNWHMVYFTPDNVVPSKHLEAWREGIEDFEYFCILQSLVDVAAKDGRDTPLTRRAKSLLTDLAGATTAKMPAAFRWPQGVSVTTATDIFD